MDKYIIGSTSSGKTRKLLELAKQNNAAVICGNPDAMSIKAQNYGIFGLEFFGYNDVLDYADEHSVFDLPEGREIVIDELGNFFKYGLHLKLEGFNMTVE